MPDVKYCGGLLEMRKIAALAEAMSLTIAPHGPASPIGNFAVSHVCAGMPNVQILEFSFGEAPWRAELVDPPELIERSPLALTDRPGCGIALNPRVVKKYLVN
jgi:galactonate dehydratase